MTSEQLCRKAFVCEQAGDNIGALNAYIEAADQCLGMVWWQLMTSGTAADVRAISVMRKTLRTFKQDGT